MSWKEGEQLFWRLLLAGQGQCPGKGAHIREALLRLLCQPGRNHVLDWGWQVWEELAQGLRWHVQMLIAQLGGRALKGQFPAEPLIDHHTERILIAGIAGLLIKMLWRHIGN